MSILVRSPACVCLFVSLSLSIHIYMYAHMHVIHIYKLNKMYIRQGLPPPSRHRRRFRQEAARAARPPRHGAAGPAGCWSWLRFAWPCLPLRGAERVPVDSKSWNMGLGRSMLVFLLLHALGLEVGHIPTFWLLL